MAQLHEEECQLCKAWLLPFLDVQVLNIQVLSFMDCMHHAAACNA